MALLVFFHVLCCQGSLLPTWTGKCGGKKKKKGSKAVLLCHYISSPLKSQSSHDVMKPNGEVKATRMAPSVHVRV